MPRRLRVVVAGPDVDVVADAVALAADDEHALDVGLQRGDAVDDVDARLLELLRPAGCSRCSSKRAFSSTMQTACLPRSAAVDQRRDERRVGAGPVDGLLDREHVRVGDGLLDEALDRGRERVVGMVDEDVALADRGEARRRPCRPRRACSRGGVTGECGGSRSSSWPESADDVPEVAEVEQALDLVDLVARRCPSAATSCSRSRGSMLGLDLEPDDLAEAAAAQLLLDRLQQVVGLVGDVVVGVAGDPEERVVDDLHAREQRAEVGGDQVVERDQGVAASPTAEEAAAAAPSAP